MQPLNAGAGGLNLPLMLAGITLHNFLVIGLLASLFIVGFKWLAAKSNISGVQAFAGAI